MQLRTENLPAVVPQALAVLAHILINPAGFQPPEYRVMDIIPLFFRLWHFLPPIFSLFPSLFLRKQQLQQFPVFLIFLQKRMAFLFFILQSKNLLHEQLFIPYSQFPQNTADIHGILISEVFRLCRQYPVHEVIDNVQPNLLLNLIRYLRKKPDIVTLREINLRRLCCNMQQFPFTNRALHQPIIRLYPCRHVLPDGLYGALCFQADWLPDCQHILLPPSIPASGRVATSVCT